MYLQKKLLSWTAACAATLLVGGVLFSACHTKAVLTSTAPTTRQHYLMALADAQRPDPSKVSNDLMPVSDDNKALEWTTVGELSEVDWLMLNMLYDPDLKCGISAQKAYDILRAKIVS